ncbi:hypothetical protein [Yoonia sp. R78084]|uniref:hypothetical protein n=1 Tax=Yoonia sp. R78084 TaxID=3093869 RepID=UPI0037DC78FA
MIRLPLALMLTTQMAVAQDFTTDAFGILPTAQLGDRANWAGLRQSPVGGDTMQNAQPADAVIFFVGPKSIVAGGEPGHAVALGLDAYGNMVSEVQAEVRLGYGPIITGNTRDGIANVLFTPPPQAGMLLAGAEIDGVQSARADYRVTADLATVLPSFAEREMRVLSETFGEIKTAPLMDAYGNSVDDGVGVSFVLTDETGGSTYLPSVVREDAARSVVLARDLAGSHNGQLALAGTSAGGLNLTVDDVLIEDAGTFVVWAEPAIDAVQIRLGPLATPNGYLVPDGTAAQVDMVASDGTRRSAQGWVLDGFVTFGLLLSPLAAPFDVSLTIAGSIVNRTVDLSPPPANLTIRGAE